MAQTLETSPATVNLAYRILRERGMIVTDGRRGTRIAPRPPLLGGRSVVASAEPGLRDLASGLPDPRLLPPVAEIVSRLDFGDVLRTGETARADPALLELAAATLADDGIPSAHIAITSGAFDAIERVLDIHLRPGDRVAVEDPTYGAFRDLLTALGLIAVPVAIDDEGPLADQFARALAGGASAALLMPRAQNPAGSARSPQRAHELRACLAEHPDVLVIEDDHAGPISGADMHAVAPATRRWAVVRSTSKTLHPDLRVAILAGDPLTISRVEGRQALGPGWVSPILQAAVAAVLRDPRLPAITANARDTYARRRATLIDALAGHGIAAHGRSGLNVWVPVHEEATTMAGLRDRGYAVSPGERFRLASPPAIRVTTAALAEDEAAAVAHAIADSQRSSPPRLY